MRPTLAVAVLLLSCGPLPTSPKNFYVSIHNNYAESLFSVAVSGGGAGKVQLFQDQRCAAFDDIKSAAYVLADTDTSVALDASSVSLGDRNNFPTLSVDPVHSGTYELTYDFDLATARFTFGHAWTY